MESFHPPAWLRNAHAQTFASALWRRRFPRLPAGEPRDFEVEPGVRIRGYCHWQERQHERPTLLLVHGLEGSCDSGYMMGLAERAWMAGWNAVRLNQRNCGGTESLSPTLYHSGLSCDYRAVVLELILELSQHGGTPAIYCAGYSMGGNLLLKMAGEFGKGAPSELRGIAAISPSLDLAACADALGLRRNWIYDQWFVTSLKRRLRRKARLCGAQYDVSALEEVRTLRAFDDRITARHFGFRDAADYYAQSSALRLAADIHVPTLIVTAQDDPFVPLASFGRLALADNPAITIIATPHGGHCAFISDARGERRFWAEWKTMEFFTGLSSEQSEQLLRNAVPAT